MADFSTVVVTQNTQAVVLSTTQQVVMVNSAIPGNYLSAPRLGFGIFSVKDPVYGATGDGVTDDTTAIQAAIDGCNTAGGGQVFFPSGIYKISAPLTLPGRVTLAGPSGWRTAGTKGAILELLPGSNCSMISVGAVAQWCVRDLRLDGKKSVQSGTSYGIDITAVSNLSDGLVENVFIDECLTDGIHVGTGQRVVAINQCFIQSSGNDGIAFAASTSDCKVTNCLIGLNGGYGINMEGIANVVQGCDIYLNLRGVHLSSARNSVIGCLLDTNQREAIVIDGVGVIVTGNCFDANCTSANNTYATIRVEDSRDAKLITGNTFQNTSAQSNLPSYHVLLSAGSYRVRGASNGMIAGTSVGGFSSAPTRLDHGEPVALYAVAAHPDADGTRSVGDDANALGWLELIIRHTVDSVKGILLKQTNAAVQASPKMFFVGGSGVAWALRNDGGTFQWLSGGTYGTNSGTSRATLSATLFATESSVGIRSASTLELVDGMAAPTQTSGVAKMYVDTADGDLKIVFGDGTIKTIVTD